MKTYQLSLSGIAFYVILMFTGCSEKKAETTYISSETADSTSVSQSEEDYYNPKSEEDTALVQNLEEEVTSVQKLEEEVTSGQKSEEDAASTQKQVQKAHSNKKFKKEIVSNQEPPEILKKKKVIKTANLRCKVKNVQDATNEIEDVVEKYDGYVTNAELETRTFQTNDIELSEDSVLHNKTYEITNRITIRVPSQYFEKVLREIQPIMAYIDYKNISGNDVSTSLLANELSKKRFAKFENRYQKQIDGKGKKLKEITLSEEKLLELQTQADMNKVHTLSLKDQINYSTLTVELYQPVASSSEVLANTDKSLSPQPNFSSRMGDSLKIGWFFFEELLIFLTKCWFLILIAVGGYWVYRKSQKLSKEKNG